MAQFDGCASHGKGNRGMNTESEVHKLVLYEARLLDEWRWDDWLDLFSDDAIYWIPIKEDVDPKLSPSIIFEDKEMLTVRIEQLARQKRLAQTPRSQTIHQITNLEVTSADSQASTVRYNLLVIEVRSGDWRHNGLGEKHFFAGRCEIAFKRIDERWKVLSKKIILLDRTQPIEGLSFLI
jgi:benzoate/toluate 1,2-dioxygenase subunit beta